MWAYELIMEGSLLCYYRLCSLLEFYKLLSLAVIGLDTWPMERLDRSQLMSSRCVIYLIFISSYHQLIYTSQHAFDSSGRLYNQEGKLEQWWTNATSERYNVIQKCIVDQYSCKSQRPMCSLGNITDGIVEMQHTT